MPDRITADREQCDGYGNCVFVAPDVFDLDDTNRVVLRQNVIDAGNRDSVWLAMAECPTRAIEIRSEPTSAG
jgi:ferredoxin